MCKLKKYHGTSNTRIDKCMKYLIENIQEQLCEDQASIVACCCGHGKYPMTILVREEVYVNGVHANYIIRDWVSDIVIPRKRNFYKRDKQGYYYIPDLRIT